MYQTLQPFVARASQVLLASPSLPIIGEKGRAKGGIPTPALKLRGGWIDLTLYDHSPGNNTSAKCWVRSVQGFSDTRRRGKTSHPRRRQLELD